MIYRHGDVNLHEVRRVKGKRVACAGRMVLAKGEATGSVHELCVDDPTQLEVYEDNGTLYLKVLSPAILRHTHDHEPLTIAPGIYRQVPERECDHFADSVIRQVVD